MIRTRKTKDLHLSFSRLYKWMKCRQDWYYTYELGLAPRIDRPQPSRGSAFHVGMAEFLKSCVLGNPSREIIADAVHAWGRHFIDTRGDMSEEEEDYLWQLAEEAIQLVNRTVDYLDIPGRWETQYLGGTPLIEYKFQVPIRGWKGFIGYVDWVAKDRQTGLTWNIDWKLRDQLQPAENEEINLQSAVYQYALYRRGFLTDGSLNIQASSALPRKPNLNKDGSMSRSRIRTDWLTYKAALIEAGLDPNDYIEMVDKLSDVEFWRLGPAPRSIKELQEVWDQIIQPVAWDMSREMQHIYRNMTPRTCVGCDFRMLCLEELRGGDIEYIKETQYISKPPKFDDDGFNKEEEVDLLATKTI